MTPIQLSLSPAQKLGLLWALILLGIGLLLWLLGNVLTPFLIAAVLAYALNPLVDKLTRLKRLPLSRSFASTIVIVLFLLLIAGLLMLVLPIVLHDLPKIQAQLPVLLDQLNAWLTPHIQRLGLPISLEVDTPKSLLAKWMQSSSAPDMSKLLSHAANTLMVGSSVVFSLFANALLIPLVLFYLLVDWPRLKATALDLVPQPLRPTLLELSGEVDYTLGQYLRGQSAVMLTMAAYYACGLWLGGLQLALPIGVITGLALLIPYVGFGLGMALAILAGLMQFGLMKTLLVVGLAYGSGQLLESYYLTPKWVGERIGLHPVLVIFALMAFGQLFGFVGMLVALPVSAILFVLWQHLLRQYKASALYTGHR